jgi:hypothetical protein
MGFKDAFLRLCEIARDSSRPVDVALQNCFDKYPAFSAVDMS